MIAIDGDLSHWGFLAGGLGTFVTATAAIIGARRAGRAASSADEAATTTKETRKQVTPSNGQPFNSEVTGRLDALAEQLAAQTAQANGQGRLLEVVAGQTHDISKRVDAQGRDIGQIRENVGAIQGQAIAISERFEDHLDEIAEDRAEWLEIKSKLQTDKEGS